MPVANHGTRHGRAASEIHSRGDKPSVSRHCTRKSYVDPLPSGLPKQEATSKGSDRDASSMPNEAESMMALVSSTSERQTDKEANATSRRTLEQEESSIDNEVKSPVQPGGVSLESLVYRILTAPMSRHDFKFRDVFLCFYRMFTTPACLLDSILTRFSHVNDGSAPLLRKVNCLLRYLNVILLWLRSYPGDFAHPATRSRLSDFATRTATHRAFAAAAHELFTEIEGVEEDDDTTWANSDFDQSLDVTTSPSRMRAGHGVVSVRRADTASQEDATIARRHDDREPDTSKRSSHSKSSSTISSSTWAESILGSSITSPSGSVDALRQGGFTAFPLTPLTKAHWHQMMDHSAEDIAYELTTIDLRMYSSIKPRDFVRHTSLSAAQREKFKALENVSRMVDHFNHLAFLVSNFVLLRNKAKHRARILEHFINIAWVCGPMPTNCRGCSPTEAETASTEQLQFPRRHRCWRWEYGRPSSDGNTRARVATGGKATDATPDTDGNTAKPFRLSACMGQHVRRQDSISASSSTGSVIC